jgi:hypothetical protein
VSDHLDEMAWATFKNGHSSETTRWIRALEQHCAEFDQDIRVVLARQVLDAEQRLKDMGTVLDSHRQTISRQGAELHAFRKTK